VTEGKDRRRYPRLPVNKRFLVRFEDTRKLRELVVRDLSRGGLFLRTPCPRPTGTKIEVILELPDGTKFPIEGVVVREAKPGSGGETGNGIRFENLTDYNRRLLAEYLDAHPSHVAPDLDPSKPLVHPGEEQALEAAVSATTMRLGDRADGKPSLPAAVETMLQLEDQVVESERYMHGTPYEILGVKEEATTADIRAAYAERLAELEAGTQGRLPIRLVERLEAARNRIGGAHDQLVDPQSRAIVDVESNLLLPTGATKATDKAFREELSARKARASAEQKHDFAASEAYARLGTEKLSAGDIVGARGLFRVALMFDPYDMEIRHLCSAAHDAIKASESSVAKTSDVVADAGTPETGATTAPPPPLERPRAAASSIALLVATVIAATAGAFAAFQWGPQIVDAGRRSAEMIGAASREEEDPSLAEADGAESEELAQWVRLMTQARTAARAGQMERAFQLAKQSYEEQPSEPALELMISAACRLGDEKQARADFERLTNATFRSQAVAACASVGIQLTGDAAEATPEELLARARDSIESGNMKEACNLARRSNEGKRTTEALKILVRCACNDRDAERARHLAKFLRRPERQSVRRACARRRIKID
jgi:curved DNA-binding protein CbpA